MVRAVHRAVAVALVAALATAAHADGPDYFHNTPDPRAVSLTVVPPRTSSQRLLIGGVALAAAISIGVGVAFNLDSRDAANQVSDRTPRGVVWTQAQQDLYDRAGRSGHFAEAFYGLGGLLAIGTLVAYWRTQPASKTIELRPGQATPTTAIVAPTRGGAIVGAAWSF
jgi:hypothetical protein